MKSVLLFLFLPIYTSILSETGKKMKTYTYLLLLLLLPFGAQSQSMYLGFKGGLNVANINNDKLNHAKLGFHAGAYFGLKFNEKMGASVELLYSQKGTHHYGDVKVVGPGPGGPLFRHDDVMVYIDYIDLPLLFNYYFTESLSGNIGLNFSVPIRGIRSYPDGRPNEDFLPLIYKNVVSLPIGITWEIGQVVNLGLRGDIGLSPIGGDLRKNNVLMLSIGFTIFRKDTEFNIGKSKKADNN